MKFLFALCLVLAISFSWQYSFKGKVAVVTGGSEGIGYETSLELARRGALVVFCARDAHPTWFNGSSSEHTINSDLKVLLNKGSARFFRADIRNSTQMKALVNFTHSLYGRIDHLVANAGIGGWVKNLTDINDEDLFGEYDPIKNNLYGTLITVREFAKYWQKYGNPNDTYSVVAISSQQGERACPSCSLYSASKHGILGLVRSFAMEFFEQKPFIRINAILPGLVNTSLTRNQVKLEKFNQQNWEGDYIDGNSPLWLPFADEFKQLLAGKRIAEPKELAMAIVSVLDNDNSFMHGSLVNVDNGDTVKS